MLCCVLLSTQRRVLELECPEYSPECRVVQERTKAFVPLPKEADEQRKALEVLKYRLRSMGGLFREG